MYERKRTNKRLTGPIGRKIALGMILGVAMVMGMTFGSAGGLEVVGGKAFAATNSEPLAAGTIIAQAQADAAKQDDQTSTDKMSEVSAEEEYTFDRTGRLDPFRPIEMVLAAEAPAVDEELPLPPLQKMDLSQLKLVAVVLTGEDANKALVEDATGMGYIIEIGTMIGRPRYKGRVVRINQDSVEIERYVGLRGEEKATITELRLRPKEGE